MISAAEVRFKASSAGPGFTFLSWDTEGGVQTKLNLLHVDTGGKFEVQTNGKWVDGAPFVLKKTDAANGSALGTGGTAELLWDVQPKGDGMVWSLKNVGGAGRIEAIRVTLRFNPVMAATTVLPAQWLPPEGFAFPAVLSAADFGQLLMREQSEKPVRGRFTGDRAKRLIDVAFEIPAPAAGKTATLEFSPWQIPVPKSVDEDVWKKIRRGWWNVYEPCVHGDGLDCFASSIKAPAGVLCNNPISDPVSSLYLFIGDHALLVPELAPGISAEYLLRYSVNWWLDQRTDAAGTVPGYADIRDMLDAPPSIIVAACVCAELSGDRKWAETHLPQLERIADYLASRDVDHDGIVESPKSGNANSLNSLKDRGATAWDAINSGHKELYINTLAYRAFCCLADLEKRLERPGQAKHYSELAGKLRDAFFRTFHSPDTQLLSWWISADGKRHDYWAPGILGLAVAYGLVPEQPAKELLARFHAKVKEVGFTRLELGLPFLLTPIRRADYNTGAGVVWGCPNREDGTDTFQHYCNGGCCVSDQIHWFNAHFRLGMAAAAQPQLEAMVNRQATPVFPNGGSFQNGIVNRQPQGAEFYTWVGAACGYEGHLIYSWFFLQGVLTEHPEYLRKVLRHTMQAPSNSF